MTFFQDGLWDVVLGFFLLEWGFSVLFDITWLSGGIFAASLWLALVFRKKVTYPRIGYAKPAEQRKQMARLIIAGAVTLLLGIMVFFLVVTHAPPQFLRVGQPVGVSVHAGESGDPSLLLGGQSLHRGAQVGLGLVGQDGILPHI